MAVVEGGNRLYRIDLASIKHVYIRLSTAYLVEMVMCMCSP